MNNVVTGRLEIRHACHCWRFVSVHYADVYDLQRQLNAARARACVECSSAAGEKDVDGSVLPIAA